jgi:hypothetical protein
MKNIYKLYNHHDIPWVNLICQAYYNDIGSPHGCQNKGSYWWRDCMPYIGQFRDITSCHVGNGKTISLWKDSWSGENLEITYPHLFSYAKNAYITMEKAMNGGSLYKLFHLPLSAIAHQEFHLLQNDIENIHLTTDHDAWILNGNATGYSTKILYIELIGEHPTPPAILDTWKTCSLPRQKFFAWIMLHKRLNTKDLMTRKNFYVQYKDCIMCDTCPEETIMHLFFECSFSQSFWWALGVEWNTDMHIHDMIFEAKN